RPRHQPEHELLHGDVETEYDSGEHHRGDQRHRGEGDHLLPGRPGHLSQLLTDFVEVLPDSGPERLALGDRSLALHRRGATVGLVTASVALLLQTLFALLHPAHFSVHRLFLIVSTDKGWQGRRDSNPQ